MKTTQGIFPAITKAVAIGMAVSSFVLGALGLIEVGTQAALLSLGLFALAVAALQNS